VELNVWPDFRASPISHKSSPDSSLPVLNRNALFHNVKKLTPTGRDRYWTLVAFELTWQIALKRVLDAQARPGVAHDEACEKATTDQDRTRDNLGLLVSCVVAVQRLSKGKMVFQSITRGFRRFPCVFAAPKRIGLKSHIRLSGVLVKAFDYVIRRLNALSAGPKSRLGA